MRNAKVILVLSQDSSIDNFACLALQLESEGVHVDFVWPRKPGPIQGVLKIAESNLRLYNPSWKIRTFNSLFCWAIYWAKNAWPRAVTFVHTPYLSDDYHRTTIKLLSRRSIGYMNYGLNIEEDTRFGFDQPEFISFSPLLVANKEEMGKFVSRGALPHNIVITGMSGPYEVFQAIENSRPINSRGLNRSLLWAPHWIDRWSTWEEVLPSIMIFAQKNQNVQIHVRAHPFLTSITSRELPEGYSVARPRSLESTQQLANFLALPNVSVSKNNLVDDCVRADWLITDGISIIGYWATTGKPIGLTRKNSSPKISQSFLSILPSSHILNVEAPGEVETWLREICNPNADVAPEESPELIEFLESKMLFNPNLSPGEIFTKWLDRSLRV